MEKFIIITRFKHLLLAMPFLLIGGTPAMAQQGESTKEAPAKEGKIKIVKVINGKTTVEEYDAKDMDGKMIWIEENEETDGEGAVEKHVIRMNAGDAGENVFEFKLDDAGAQDGEKKVIRIEMDTDGGEHPHMIMIDEDAQQLEELGGAGEGKKMIFITKEVESSGTPDGKMKVHTIKVINGDTVLNDIREGDEGTMIWKEKGDLPEDAQIMIMHLDTDEDAAVLEKDVDVKVIKDGNREYKYEMIVIRSCKSVKVEEPAAAEMEKLGGQGQGANSLDVKKLEAFPSPNEGRFTVRFTLKDKNPALMSIFSLEGQEIYQENFSGSKSYEKQIDLGDVPAGVYLLRITQGDESMTRRLVIE